MKTEYRCPNCGYEHVEGRFGEDVTCDQCGRTYETDYKTVDHVWGYTLAWIVREKELQHAS